MLTSQQIVDKFDMKPLSQEGGYYKEIKFSDIIIAKDDLPVSVEYGDVAAGRADVNADIEAAAGSQRYRMTPPRLL